MGTLLCHISTVLSQRLIIGAQASDGQAVANGGGGG
jgi:hypothetical protein